VTARTRSRTSARSAGHDSTTRRLACDALVRIEQGAYAHVVVPAMLRRSVLPARDRAQVTDLVNGVMRARRRLDDLLRRVSDRPVERLDPPVRAALRVGALQLVEGVPAYAAVGEAVEATPRRARGYVNATLRALARLGPEWPDPGDEAIALSYPDALVDLLRADLGEEDARDLLVAANEPAALTLRVNPRRAEVDSVASELTGRGASVTRGALRRDALVVRGAGDPARLPVVARGAATPQDQASQVVVQYLDPGGNDRVLEVAAAPGGKATGIAERLDRGYVVACDLHAGRLRLVRAAAARLGLSNVHLLVADGGTPPVRESSFDRVLVDAPCSGLGVLRRRTDARWRIDPQAIPRLAALQLSMVLAAARAVRRGGILVYSVCTVTRAETVGVASAIVAALPGWSGLAPPGPPWRAHGPGGLLLPQTAGTDGMFVLGLRRGDG
jgi:16S rRNA (cytosine967-C5)-methyltransferase